jgi:hypothetical protein
MATTRVTWFGVVVDFDDAELSTIITHLTTGAATAGTLTALLASFGVTGPIAAVSGIITALLGLGAAALGSCNASHRGIHLTVLWVGLPWCKSQ